MRFLSREALSQPPSRRNRQTMGFKLPHDVVSTCAKRDEPPSRRQPLELSPFWISYTLQNSSDFVGVCGEAFSVFSGLQKIRVNSCPFVVENQRFGCGKGRSKTIPCPFRS
ncbi:MAG: hypothetical protein K6G44_08770 [Lentisphaeria bacterium]|nr:hypothetical protein [Lentisphaeria bacterium]